jgi:pentatricopeptide repeat protein
MYAKCGMLAEAREVFDKLTRHDVVAWNALITGYSDHNLSEEAFDCLQKMQVEDISPNAITLTGCLKACGTTRDMDKVRKLHVEIKRRGLLKRDSMLGSILVAAYAKCGSISEAQEAFRTVPIRDVVAWTALISGYVQHNRCEEALGCFTEMKSEGILPDAVTYTCILKACGSLGAQDKGIEIFNAVTNEEGRRCPLPHTETNVANALVDMYAKCGMLAKAQEVFDSIPVHDIVTWTALITGYAELGEVEEAATTFAKMVGEGCKPNGVTFLGILAACGNVGLIEQAHICFDAMQGGYGVIPILDHQTCMVDVLARAGQLESAVELAEKAPVLPNTVMWLTLLGACRKWGNLPLARGVFKHVVQVDEMDAAVYVCMANIYADVGMPTDADAMANNEIELYL